MSAVPFAFSISMRDVCASLLLLERRLLLVGDLALGQHLDQLVGELDVLDVDALASRPRRRRGSSVTRSNAGACTSWRVSMNVTASSVLQRVAEVVADRRLQHLVDEVHASCRPSRSPSAPWCRARGSAPAGRCVNTKPSRLLPSIGDSWASRLCAWLTGVGPVEREDRTSARSRPRSTRGLIGYLPVRSGSCQMPRWPGRTIEPNLNSSPRRVERGQAHERP